MSDTNDVESLRQISENLATATKELKVTADRIADAVKTQSSSTVQINAGGLSSAIALVGAGMNTVLFVILAMWVIWQDAERRAQQEAWVGVWQGKIATLMAEHHKEK